MTCVTLAVVFLNFVLQVNSGRILAVFPTPSVSHQVVFRPITQELAKRGHEVVIITPDPAFPTGNTPENLTEIDVQGPSYEKWREMLIDVMDSNMALLPQMKSIYTAVAKVFEVQINMKEVKDIIEKKSGEFDLILTEACVRSALGFSHIYKVPVIQISSFGPVAFNDEYIGAYTHPLLFPIPWYTKTYNLNAVEKIDKLRTHWDFKTFFNYDLEVEENKILKAAFGDDIPDLAELKNNIAMLILNVYPIWTDNQPVPPNVVYIGGIHQNPKKDLPKSNSNICPIMTFAVYLLGVLSLVAKINSSRILVVVPAASLSHQVVFRPITQELARRGYEVVVITADPAFPKGEAPENLTEIDVHDASYEMWMRAMREEIMGERNLVAQMKSIYASLAKVFEVQIHLREVRDVIEKKMGEFDLLLTEACARPALGYSHVFKVPLIQISSFGAGTFNDDYIGANTHPLLFPIPWHDKTYNLTVWEKINKIWNHYDFKLFYNNYLEREENRILKEVFGEDIPDLEELKNNIVMLFLNMHPLWVDNQPVPPNVVYIGGIHRKPKKDLPKDLQSYLDASKQGVIYVSFGTNVIPSALPQNFVHGLLTVLSQIPYNVLLKWDTESLPITSKNIKVAKWFPQSDILRHPNVKAFITQGGLQSTDEAITAEVPMVGVPVIADQWYNVDKYVKHGIGVRILIESFNEKDFRTAIETVISDKSYRKNIVKLRDLIQDQPNAPLERAVWWVEYVLRHGGAHLRPPTANMSLYRYLELDVIFTLLAVATAGIAAILLALYVLWTFITKLNIKSKLKRA